MDRPYWTNKSVAILAGTADPVQAVVDRARSLVMRARDAGWDGPPFDPIQLADLLGVAVVPTADVVDGRLELTETGSRIEFNPTRPAGRRRFSLAHEIAHLLFDDWADAVRNRAKADRGASDGLQLEMLCNIAAAEFLMPVGSFPELRNEALDLHHLLALRKRFDVSTEALLLRVVHLTQEPVAMFAASRIAEDQSDYRIDYSVSSAKWPIPLRTGTIIPAPTSVSECTAIGYTASGSEEWILGHGRQTIEAVGIPAYPAHRFPRVVGLVRPSYDLPHSEGPNLRIVFGDATQPRGNGPRVITHIVNDRARRFHGGFAGALSRRWPRTAADYTDWVTETESLNLGDVHFTEVEAELWVAHLVAQHGYGKSPKPRIRYQALRESLSTLGTWSERNRANVHMPRIGTGQAGGNWDVVLDLVVEELLGRGVSVTVYDPPGQEPAESQLKLELGA